MYAKQIVIIIKFCNSTHNINSFAITIVVQRNKVWKKSEIKDNKG